MLIRALVPRGFCNVEYIDVVSLVMDQLIFGLTRLKEEFDQACTCNLAKLKNM